MTIENVADLQVLVHTARGGTLTAAAQSMGVTPAAASAMLKRLESRLGCRLFERSTRAMRLTPRGQTLLDYALRAFELLAEGEAQVTADLGALVGPCASPLRRIWRAPPCSPGSTSSSRRIPVWSWPCWCATCRSM
ncbi:LysR family transcriptional regulator [Cystobacter fuscus]